MAKKLKKTTRNGNFPAYFGGLRECGAGHLIALCGGPERKECPTCRRERAHGAK